MSNEPTQSPGPENPDNHPAESANTTPAAPESPDAAPETGAVDIGESEEVARAVSADDPSPDASETPHDEVVTSASAEEIEEHHEAAEIIAEEAVTATADDTGIDELSTGEPIIDDIEDDIEAEESPVADVSPAMAETSETAEDPMAEVTPEGESEEAIASVPPPNATDTDITTTDGSGTADENFDETLDSEESEPSSPVDAEAETTPETESIESGESIVSPGETEAPEVDSEATADVTTSEDAEEIPDISPPPAPTPAAASPAPPADMGTIQKGLAIVRTGTVWTLQTSVRGLDWTTQLLDRWKHSPTPPAEEPEKDPFEQLWGAVAPILLTVSLTVVTSLSAASKWSLRQLNAEIPTPSAETEVEPSKVTTIASSIWQKIQPILVQLWRLWRRLLAILRERVLPGGLKKLSDNTLTVFAVALLMGILWLTSALTPSRQPVPIAITGTPEPSDVVEPKPSEPQPQPAITVDQKRLVALQEKMADVADSYAKGIVQSVQPDAPGDRLIITLGPAWYRLDAYYQDQLAADLLKQAQRLDFDKLEVLDILGDRIARSPVVGRQMIIFQRTSEIMAAMEEPSAQEKAASEDSSPEEEGISPETVHDDDTALGNEATGDLENDGKTTPPNLD